MGPGVERASFEAGGGLGGLDPVQALEDRLAQHAAHRVGIAAARVLAHGVEERLRGAHAEVGGEEERLELVEERVVDPATAEHAAEPAEERLARAGEPLAQRARGGRRRRRRRGSHGRRERGLRCVLGGRRRGCGNGDRLRRGGRCGSKRGLGPRGGRRRRARGPGRLRGRGGALGGRRSSQRLTGRRRLDRRRGRRSATPSEPAQQQQHEQRRRERGRRAGGHGRVRGGPGLHLLQRLLQPLAERGRIHGAGEDTRAAPGRPASAPSRRERAGAQRSSTLTSLLTPFSSIVTP